jgi:predicted MPP superfamily phosphohydrolase
LNVDEIARIPSKGENTLRIAMSHYPDALRRIGRLEADLFLTGHTHGGQICLPGRIPIIKHDSLPRPYCTGVHRVDDTWLVVNRGIGFTTLPIRVFCPSEVIEIKVLSDER